MSTWFVRSHKKELRFTGVQKIGRNLRKALIHKRWSLFKSLCTMFITFVQNSKNYCYCQPNPLSACEKLSYAQEVEDLNAQLKINCK